MGCDGGTIPTRDELVRLKKKPEQKDKNSELVAKWKHCALTQEPLRPPVVACEIGRLYSKESVLEFLLDKSKYEGVCGFDHIRGLKDVKALQLSDNPAYKEVKDLGDAYVDRLVAPYICPVTGLEMSGRHRFVYLRGCGCAFSERALKEIKSDLCVKCGEAFQSDDVIVLNGSDDDFDDLYKRMDARRLKAKLDKKAKKKSKGSSAEASNGESDRGSEEGPSTSKKAKLDIPKGAVNGKGGATKLNGSSAAAIGSKLNGKVEEKKASSSIQKDPKASAIYKGLFTTCEKAKNQPKGHWVTYNPQYN